MSSPIVSVTTSDNLTLFGLLREAPQSQTLFLHTHGTASNFYEEYFVEVLSDALTAQGISVLSANNRGAGVYDAYQKSGAAVELFEDCVKDVDAWMEFAREKGYTRVILSGHSLGTEKVVYYMSHGAHVSSISAVVLLAPATSPGSEPRLLGDERLALLMREATDLVQQGKGDTFLPRDAYGAILPKSANSFLNFLDPGSEIQKALPFHTGTLELFSRITVPVLTVIGDQQEYTGIPIKDALDLLKKENPNAQVCQLQNCDHDFREKERELADIVFQFIQDHV